jgi:metal-responsive CopG/Arc/MetJ family transcriptional regulator
MRNSTKFTVSIPMKEYKEMEIVRKKAGSTRSAFFLEVLRSWKTARRRENAAKTYVNGYRETPEDPALAEALSRAAAEMFEAGEWK